MRRVRCSIFLWVLACGCGAAASRAPARTVSSITDCATLVAALRNAGADVQLGGRAAQPFMPVAAQLLSVDGAAVQVFELPDDESARVLAARIAPDASSVGQATVAWSAPPHFFRSGRAIVLYVGDDPRILARLARVLGEPIATGRADKRPAMPEDWVPTTRA